MLVIFLIINNGLNLEHEYLKIIDANYLLHTNSLVQNLRRFVFNTL